MKHPYFLRQIKVKKIKCCLLQLLFSSLRVNAHPEKGFSNCDLNFTLTREDSWLFICPKMILNFSDDQLLLGLQSW